MSTFVVSPVTPDDIPRLAEIQEAAVADSPLRRAAFAAVSKEDYTAWYAHGLAHAAAPPGLRTEVWCARKPETGEVGGWARWFMPANDGEAPAPAPLAERTPAPLPRGMDTHVWDAAIKEIIGHQARVMGTRKTWTLVVLAVDPAFQRRGLGTLLTLHGVKRAHTEGLPVVLFASPQGAPLYAALGFETKDAPTFQSTGHVVPFMISEPAGGA